ncbi:hypothetical protein PHYPO_G00083130 [Pangasianodon hypophthalmus]|uniref:Beta-microseminoprotein n=1 Tax=Pangasianodon hypophthalmus TaxID=310915 RepID=A0A5N5LMB8_PANHP|nr:hypothetical protein PHYPO_G00083130 [Pangasianodon hypophthalmus]
MGNSAQAVTLGQDRTEDSRGHRFQTLECSLELGKMSMLKWSVFVVFFLLALVPVSNAACWQKILKPGVTHCQDDLDKTWHPVGSSWINKQCLRCECKDGHMTCCHRWPTSVSGGCTIKYDHQTCTYELIYPDKSLPCRAIG